MSTGDVLFREWRDSPEFQVAFTAFLLSADQRALRLSSYEYNAEPADFAAWCRTRPDRKHEGHR